MASSTTGHYQQTPPVVTPPKTKKVRVVYLDTTRFFGPLMQVHSSAMRHLDPEQYEVFLLADPESGSTEVLRDLPHLGIWLAPLASPADAESKDRGRFHKLARNLSIMAGLPKMAWNMWKQRVDVLHAGMTVRMMAVGLFLSLVSGARLVIHVHEVPRLNSTFKRLLFKVCMARAAGVIAVSGFIKDQLAAAGAKRAKIIAILNTVDLDRFRPEVSGEQVRSEYGITPGDVLIVCLGRFVPGKGQLYLAKAMAMARERAPGVKALLIGWEDPSQAPNRRTYKEEVIEFCRRRSLGDTVIIGDARPDAPEIMAAANIVAVPSTDDPCPLTVLEAMASGKPVVGFQSGGIPEEVGVDGSAILVEPGDVMGLARAIVDLAHDPNTRQEQGRQARQRAERLFYEERLAADVMQVYEWVTGRTPTAPQAAAPGESNY